MAQANQMLFWSFFKSLAQNSHTGGAADELQTGAAQPGISSSLLGNPVRIAIELKSGVKVEGNLEQVDEQMNFHLSDIKLLQTIGNVERQVPHMSMCSSTFIRGNVIRYVHLNKLDVDTEPLTEACRNEVKRVQNR